MNTNMKKKQVHVHVDAHHKDWPQTHHTVLVSFMVSGGNVFGKYGSAPPTRMGSGFAIGYLDGIPAGIWQDGIKHKLVVYYFSLLLFPCILYLMVLKRK